MENFLQKMDGGVTMSELQKALVDFGKELGMSYGQPEYLKK